MVIHSNQLLVDLKEYGVLKKTELYVLYHIILDHSMPFRYKYQEFTFYCESLKQE